MFLSWQVMAENSEYTRWANENNVQAGQYVLSNKPALLLRSLLARESGEITMRFAKEKAEVRMNTFSMTCRLIDGKFPGIQQSCSQKQSQPSYCESHGVYKYVAPRTSVFRCGEFSCETSHGG